MRIALIISALIVIPFFLPASATVPYIPPKLSLVLFPPSMEVIANASRTTSVSFNGNVTLEMGKMDTGTHTVALLPWSDSGLTCTASPSELTFSDSGTQSFFCIIQVPHNCTKVTATITVSGDADDGRVHATASAQLSVRPPILDATPADQTVPGVFSGDTGPIVIGAIGAVLIAVVAVAAYIIIKRTRSKRQQGSQ